MLSHYRRTCLFARRACNPILLFACWSTVVGASSDSIAGLGFEKDLARVRAEIANEAVFNRHTCAEYIILNTDFLVERGAASYRPQTADELQRLREQGPRLLREMFYLRLELANQIRGFYRSGPLEVSCVEAVRRAFRYSRFIEELIAEFLVAEQMNELPSTPLEGSAPSMMVNPAYDPLDLRSGDLLLVRSPSFISAAIARIGDEDGQFSHLGLVFVADDGSRFVIEALIESGVVISPLDEWLTEERDRLLVLGYGDRRLAEKAAQDMYHLVQSQRSKGSIIPYDFDMDRSDSSELFCAELVGFAYEMASNGSLTLPAYPTSLQALRDHPFLEDLGVGSSTTFSPGDMEVDPRFQLVAEWRDLRNTAESRIQDAILTSVLEWMADREYRLTHRGLAQVQLDVYWHFLRPLGIGKDKLSWNAKKSFVKSALALQSVAELIYRRVAPPLQEALRQDPLALDYRVILALVEDYRVRDCKRLIDYRRWLHDNPVHMGLADRPVSPELHFLIAPAAAEACRQ